MSLTLNGIYHYEAVAAGDYPDIIVYDDVSSVNDLIMIHAQDGPGDLGQNTITRFDTDFGLDWLDLIVGLHDSTRTAFSSPDLPGSLNLDDFTSSVFSITGFTPYEVSTGFRISGYLTSLRVAVPEPGTAFLELVGLALHSLPLYCK